MTRLYDRIKQLLTDNPELRDSDRKLIWRVWDDEGSLTHSWEGERQVITDYDFMKATSTESIRRARQLVQENNPELRSSKKIQQAKDLKESSKGTFAFREETPVNETIKLI